MTFTPDPSEFQQLRPHPYAVINVPYTGPVDCTAWSGAWAHNAHTLGLHRISGAQVRKHSNEPKPDPGSPGLNLHQIDAAIMELSNGHVDLDIRTGYDYDLFRKRILDGQWGVVQVNRGILVAHGYGGGNGFPGGHADTVHAVPGAVPALGDPLVDDHYIRMSDWHVLELAAGALDTGAGTVGFGKINVGFTRDITPDWIVDIPAHTRFTSFTVSGKPPHVTGGPFKHKTTTRFRKRCTPPAYYPWPHHDKIKLVRVIRDDGTLGLWVRAKWADKVE